MYPNFCGQLDNANNVTGVGRYVINNGTIYEGQIYNHQMNGYGRFIYANGDHYVGCFANHKKNGEGTYYASRSGKKQQGKWVNDRYIGQQQKSAPLD